MYMYVYIYMYRQARAPTHTHKYSATGGHTEIVALGLRFGCSASWTKEFINRRDLR